MHSGGHVLRGVPRLVAELVDGRSHFGPVEDRLTLIIGNHSGADGREMRACAPASKQVRGHMDATSTIPPQELRDCTKCGSGQMQFRAELTDVLHTKKRLAVWQCESCEAVEMIEAGGLSATG